MVSIINFPTRIDAELLLKDALKELGINQIVLDHWEITIMASHATWRYDIALQWRNYRIKESFDKYDLSLRNNDIMLQMAHSIARHLYKFNTAEDEEHMEALMLLSMRPTNGPHNQQL